MRQRPKLPLLRHLQFLRFGGQPMPVESDTGLPGNRPLRELHQVPKSDLLRLLSGDLSSGFIDHRQLSLLFDGGHLHGLLSEILHSEWKMRLGSKRVEGMHLLQFGRPMRGVSRRLHIE